MQAWIGRALLPLMVIWLGLLAAGFKVQMDYERAPGAKGEVEARWPAGSGLEGPSGGSLWVLFLHPRCPCSRASLQELKLLLAEARRPTRAVVVFTLPREAGDAWSEGELWREARAWAGARVVADRDGSEARRFGARTSGQALLYDASGRLRFEGGLTPGRGSAADASGRRAAAARWSESAGPAERAPVFGCALPLTDD